MAKQEPSNPNTWRIPFLITATLLLVLVSAEIYFRIIPDNIENVGASLLIPKPSPSHQPPTEDDTIGSVFRKIDILEDMGPAGDEAWDSLLLPKKGGYIFARPEDPASNEAEPWGITMFHSLHCLSMLRSAIQEQQGENSSNAHVHNHNHNHTRRDGVEDVNHTVHCLSYLAQALTCCGDGTLEKAIHLDEPDRRFAINGQGVWHQCRDTSLLWDITMKSTREPVDRWVSRRGETVYSVWGKGGRTN
ncbi:hypothetical protein DTO271D3_2161 [Paecilomyces variotii]|nr:hypothetical protein DTO195F2_7577 [Paecilomyces variotii]KAJ9317695.1 hypothetical protein DTO271D3_2161 [Paecilomyces variotii]KAJ9370535.1 hypothetical protein DTO282E5_4703 [Paecilomyces variotii]